MTLNVRTILSLTADLPALSARRVLSAVIAAADAEERNPYAKRAAAAFSDGLKSLRKILIAALHEGDLRAMRGVRRALPMLLKEANRDRAFAEILGEMMAHAFFTAFFTEVRETALKAANASIGNVSFSEEPVVSEAMKQWRSREVFETDLSSAELRGFASEIRNRAIFSARTTNAEYLKDVAAQVDEVLSGKINMATARWHLMKKLKELGYDPKTGFPEDLGAVPPAERDSLQDLSSARRIDLLLETNVRMAQGYGQTLAGNTDNARYAYPAWELVRLYHRDVPRGSAESNSAGWQRRWMDAGAAVDWEGASQNRLMATKASPIWDALGDGAGGYTDTLLNPFPPFAFRSGMGWRAVAREDVEGEEFAQASRPTRVPVLTPSHKEVQRIVNEMPADLAAELRRELGL